jgi:hypothetical protein
MMSSEYAGLAIMMNLGHWAFSKHIDGVDLNLERDTLIRQLKQGLGELADALKQALPGAAVWICPETCVRLGRCGDCHRSGDPMFKVYYERPHLDDEVIQRIRMGMLKPVTQLLPLSEEQKQTITTDIAQVPMVRIGSHGGTA